jgi:hypothetical protein
MKGWFVASSLTRRSGRARAAWALVAASLFSLLVNAGTSMSAEGEPRIAATPANELPGEWHDFSGDGRSDLIAREASTGNVYIYRHSGSFNGTSTFDQRFLVLTGAQSFNWMGVTDITGDFTTDLVARLSDGTMVAYPGTGDPLGLTTFEAPITIGSGWNGVSAMQLADVTGDGYADITGRWAGGELYVYPHTGMFDGVNTLSSPELLGTGWNIYDWIGSAEATSDDEKPDLVGRRPGDGTLQLYPHKRFYEGSTTYVGPVQVGTGWNTVQPLTMTDVNGDNFTDIVARRGNDLIVYPNAGGYDGDNTFRAPTTVGAGGWTGMDLVA